MSDKYAFIAAECAVHREGPTIALMCIWLGVSKSGFYEWTVGRPARPRSAGNC